jgi:hypothetical protein
LLGWKVRFDMASSEVKVIKRLEIMRSIGGPCQIGSLLA